MPARRRLGGSLALPSGPDRTLLGSVHGKPSFAVRMQWDHELGIRPRVEGEGAARGSVLTIGGESAANRCRTDPVAWRFMESPLSRMRMQWDHEPWIRPKAEGEEAARGSPIRGSGQETKFPPVPIYRTFYVYLLLAGLTRPAARRLCRLDSRRRSVQSPIWL